MTKTDALILEIKRTLAALEEYKLLPEYPSIAHAAAKRATLDLTRKLAEWRKTGVRYNGVK